MDEESLKKAQEIAEFMRNKRLGSASNNLNFQNSRGEQTKPAGSSFQINRWTEPGWGNSMHYWKCPRCDGNDLYYAPRQVSTYGLGRQFDGFDADSELDQVGFVQRPVERNVLLCKNCGEKAVRHTRVKTSAELEREKQVNREIRESGVIWAILGVLGFFGLCFFVVVWGLFS